MHLTTWRLGQECQLQLRQPSEMSNVSSIEVQQPNFGSFYQSLVNDITSSVKELSMTIYNL